MLILERKERESLIIQNDEDEIEIIFFKDKNGKNKIGINAPDHFNIVRDELLENGG